MKDDEYRMLTRGRQTASFIGAEWFITRRPCLLCKGATALADRDATDQDQKPIRYPTQVVERISP